MSNPPPPTNLVKARLAAGEPCYIMGVRHARTIDIVAIAQASGHHGFYIDLQHCTMPEDIAAQMCFAGLLAGITPLVRLPGLDGSICEHMLEAGALGIIAPDLRSADEARQLVSWCRFPPSGVRAPVLAGAHTRFGPPDQTVDRPRIEAETLVIAMLESETAIRAAPDIAAVPGIDALLIGTNDLTSSMNIHGQYDHPRVREAYAHAIDAARAHGKHLIVGGIRDPKVASTYVSAGAANCYITGMDNALLLSGALAQVERFRALDAR